MYEDEACVKKGVYVCERIKCVLMGVYDEEVWVCFCVCLCEEDVYEDEVCVCVCVCAGVRVRGKRVRRACLCEEGL